MELKLLVAVVFTTFGLSLTNVNRGNIPDHGYNETLTVPTQPYHSNTGNTSQPDCNLTVSKASLNKFRHFVFALNLNFVYLNLTINDGLTLKRIPTVIEDNIWTWTFFGKDGALEFLKWPTEFRIWSMGFLASTVFSIPIELVHVSGDCTNVTVGTRHYDLVISKALKPLVLEMMELDDGEKYGPSYFCYKKRLLIQSDWLYNLCKQVVCPADVISYACCTYKYNNNKQERQMDCNHRYNNNKFMLDEVWTLLPLIVAVLLFAYSPLCLMLIASKFKFGKDDHTTNTPSTGIQSNIFEEIEDDALVFYDGTSHITLLHTILYPCSTVCTTRGSHFSRLLRFLFPILSLSFIDIQIVLDHVYLRSFVIDCINMGVPMGFRSLIAGYTESKRNFLQCLGGPYVALALYLVLTCSALTLPTSLQHFLSNGLSKRNDNSPNTIFYLGLWHIEMFGNVQIQGTDGYKKLYHTCLAQIYMLLNARFWKFAMGTQIERWRRFCKGIAYYIVLPVYWIICFFEIVFCILLHGVPLFALGGTILRAYLGSLVKLTNVSHRCRCFLIILVMCLFPVMFTWIVVSLYMACLVFLDGCLFLTRIFMFSYTGIVVYPKQSYGYIIFAMTVIFYIWTCVSDFANHYDEILKTVIKVCRKIQEKTNSYQLVFTCDDNKGVSQAMYNYVIEKYSPTRIKVFISFLKLGVILGIIGVSIYLLMRMDRIRDMHIFIHVITALFTCSLPQIVKSVFMHSSENYKRKAFQRKIHSVVCEYLKEHDLENSMG